MGGCAWLVPVCYEHPFFPPGDAPLGRLQDIPLPNPNISFHLWKEDDQLCEWGIRAGSGKLWEKG